MPAMGLSGETETQEVKYYRKNEFRMKTTKL